MCVGDREKAEKKGKMGSPTSINHQCVLPPRQGSQGEDEGEERDEEEEARESERDQVEREEGNCWLRRTNGRWES